MASYKHYSDKYYNDSISIPASQSLPRHQYIPPPTTLPPPKFAKNFAPNYKQESVKDLKTQLKRLQKSKQSVIRLYNNLKGNYIKDLVSLLCFDGKVRVFPNYQQRLLTLPVINHKRIIFNGSYASNVDRHLENSSLARQGLPTLPMIASKLRDLSQKYKSLEKHTFSPFDKEIFQSDVSDITEASSETNDTSNTQSNDAPKSDDVATKNVTESVASSEEYKSAKETPPNLSSQSSLSSLTLCGSEKEYAPSFEEDKTEGDPALSIPDSERSEMAKIDELLDGDDSEDEKEENHHDLEKPGLLDTLKDPLMAAAPLASIQPQKQWQAIADTHNTATNSLSSSIRESLPRVPATEENKQV